MRYDNAQIEPTAPRAWRLMFKPLSDNNRSGFHARHTHIPCGPIRRAADTTSCVRWAAVLAVGACLFAASGRTTLEVTNGVYSANHTEEAL